MLHFVVQDGFYTLMRRITNCFMDLKNGKYGVNTHGLINHHEIDKKLRFWELSTMWRKQERLNYYYKRDVIHSNYGYMQQKHEYLFGHARVA